MLDLTKDGSKSIKAVLDYSARVCHSDTELTTRDKRLLAEVILSRAYLLLDLTHSPRVAEGYWRALMSLKTLDAKLYAQTVKASRQYLLDSIQGYRRGDFADYVRRFKPDAGGIYYKWMITPLAHLEQVHETEEAILCCALQWVSYDTKLNLRDVDYSTQLCVEYLDDEYAMSRFTYDSSVIQAMRQIVTEWTLGMETIPESAPWHFRHGNGATTELPRSQASPLTKCGFFRISPDDARYFSWRGSVEDFDFEDLTVRPRLVEETTPIVVDFVPKSPLTNRVISPEHVTKMWAQNDLFWLMDRMFRESHVNVHLHNQEASRRMALIGSRDGRYDTFDFSKASDFVTLELVSQVTEDTWLHNPLLWSRSKFATVGKGGKRRAGLDQPVTIRLHKFAPMGSSTCFPTESLLFAATCELAVRQTLGRRSIAGDYLVYGDDCVIRSDCSDAFRFLSSLLHFKVNDDKTCRYRDRHCFREACGIEALDGQVVTPLRVSRRFVGCLSLILDRATTPGEAIGVCDWINRIYSSGFVNLRKYFNSLLRQWTKFEHVLRIDEQDYARLQKFWSRGVETYSGLPLPYFVVDSSTATNYRCKSRFNRSLHRQEVLVWTVRPAIERSAPSFDEERLFLYLLQAQKWDSSDSYDSDLVRDAELTAATGSGPLRWKKCWISI